MGVGDGHFPSLRSSCQRLGLRIILNFMKYLLVVAHPDDEVLGAGASMWKWSHDGDEVEVCIMSTEAKARAFRPSDAELEVYTDAAVS